MMTAAAGGGVRGRGSAFSMSGAGRLARGAPQSVHLSARGQFSYVPVNIHTDTHIQVMNSFSFIGGSILER